MKYKKIHINKYKGIVDSTVPVAERPIPIIGVNESGKSSALEALAYFDWRNDEIIKNKGWKFQNRYKPAESEFSVVAEIEISQAELDEVLKDYYGTGEEAEPEPAAEPAAPRPATEPEAASSEADDDDEYQDITLSKRGTITVTRSFVIDSTGKETMVYWVNEDQSPANENIARDILGKLPRLYYIGDFLESPIPDVVSFQQEYAAGGEISLSEHQKVIEGAFQSAGKSLKDCINHQDKHARDTWIEEVSTEMANKIIKEWDSMHVKGDVLDVANSSSVSIKLQLSESKENITISIMEEFVDGDEKLSAISTPLSERSLGFRWFFNFSAIKCFAAQNNDKFIYLFDEPGSYLHNSAQQVLLDAMIELAEEHPVVYATHSEFLLDPERININNIKAVQKEKREIKLIPLSETKNKRHGGALSTLNHALRLKTPLETILKKKVIVTEGITDYYFWKPLVDTPFLPGFGAGKNKYLLSLSIGSSQRYVALFDGDNAGDEAIEGYKVFFGENEATNWFQYTNSQNAPVKLEQLLSNSDKQRLLKLTNQTKVKRATTELFFSKQTKEFWDGINKETRENVSANLAKITKHLNLNKKYVKL